MVNFFDIRAPHGGKQRVLQLRSLELNSVHCNPLNRQFCVGGADEFVRLYDLRMTGGSTDAPASQVGVWAWVRG